MRALVAALLAAVLAQHVAVYRARHRPVGELAGLAESSLAGAGRVAVDARTASLVLSGPRADVDRALSLLRALDRPLRTVVVEHALEETESLEAAGLRVDWSAERGPLRVGELVAAAEGGRLSARAEHSRLTRAFQGRLRALEGEPVLLLTGTSRVIGRVFPVEQSAESGFEAVATLLDSGRVHVELRPFHGRFEAGGVRYTAAATALQVEPGETVVVGETATGSERAVVALPGGGGVEAIRERRLLLLRVTVEP